MNLRNFYAQQKNFLVGFLLLFLLALMLIFSCQKKGQNTSSDDLILFATYNKADGVNVGSVIRLAGKQIGCVSDIKLDKYYRVQVKMTITEDILLPMDSAAMIETDGIVGGKYIEILPGADEEMMQSGDFFFYTQDVLLLDELLERFLGMMRTKKGIESTMIKGEE